MKNQNIVNKFKVNYFAYICGEKVTGNEPISIPLTRWDAGRQFAANVTLSKSGEPPLRGVSEDTLRSWLSGTGSEHLKSQYRFWLQVNGRGTILASGYLTKCIGGWWIIEQWGANDNVVRIPWDDLYSAMTDGITLFVDNFEVGKIRNRLSLGKKVKVHDDNTGLHFWEDTKLRGNSAVLTLSGDTVTVSDFSTAGR